MADYSVNGSQTVASPDDTTLTLERGASKRFKVFDFTSGFTHANVPASSPTLTSMKFNYEQVSRAFTQICDQIGWDWYVDPDKDIHFFFA